MLLSVCNPCAVICSSCLGLFCSQVTSSGVITLFLYIFCIVPDSFPSAANLCEMINLETIVNSFVRKIEIEERSRISL